MPNSFSIKDDYFEPTCYSESINIKFKAEIYEWNCTTTDPYDTEITLNKDLSDKVVNVTYDCDSGSDIKTSAALTLYVPPDDDFWYMNREYDVRSVSIGDGGHRNTVWIPQIYYIEQRFEFNNDTSKATESDPNYQINTRILGFFIPDSGNYLYNTVTNQLTLQLRGLSMAFTSEMGGGIITPVSSFDYYFDMPYNNSPTKITAYRVETKENGTKTTAVQKPALKTKEEEEKEYVRNGEEECYNAIPEIIKQKGVVFGTAPVVNQKNNVTAGSKRINTPLPLSISGEDGGVFKFFYGSDIAEIIYRIAMCRMDAQLSTYHLPLVNYIPPSADCETTSKSLIFPNGWDFENGTSVMEIAKKMLGDKYYEPMIWVDEDRRLCIEARATYPNEYRNYIPYRDIQKQIIDETISMDDNDFYTVTEVFGKNGEYYGVYDGTFDAFKTILGNTHESVLGNMTASFLSKIPKTQVIHDESIESDEECFQRAVYETWKSSRGHTKITVKLADNMIRGTERMSHVVGESFVEYRTLQGGGKTILCNLEKASLSNNVWTWELTPFDSFAPIYDDLSSGYYIRWKTEHYDEWLGYKYNGEWLKSSPDGSNLLTFKQKNTLAEPAFSGWELIDGHILRLYITSEDMDMSVVKLWTASHDGASNYGTFLGESVKTGDLNCKVFDYPITQNGKYSFICGLYSPYREQSTSLPFDVYVTGVYVPETQIKDDNKPDDGEGGESGGSSGTIIIPQHTPYLTDEYGNKLTDENNNRLTI